MAKNTKQLVARSKELAAQIEGFIFAVLDGEGLNAPPPAKDLGQLPYELERLRPVSNDLAVSFDQPLAYVDPNAEGHFYRVPNCYGWNAEAGASGLCENASAMSFVYKREDMETIPGLTTEQVLAVLIDRHETLQKGPYPSPTHALLIASLKAALLACSLRVSDRVDRHVMGEHKV